MGATKSVSARPGADEERAASLAAREYHEKVKPEWTAKSRAQLLTLLQSFYKDRLRVEPTPGQTRSLNSMSDPDALFLEIAHDGQLPHLGIVRMVLKTRELAEIDGNGVPLYIVGNHYTAKMRPDNLHFGMPLNGKPPNQVRDPPRVGVGSGNADVPFRWLPPPSRKELDRLRAQLKEYIAQNVHFAAANGLRLVPQARDRMNDRLSDLFHALVAAAKTTTFGDWLLRVQNDLFTRLLGPEQNNILIVPMADLAPLLRFELRKIASSEQSAKFWVYCPTCYHRQRLEWTGGDSAQYRCSRCTTRSDVSGEEFWRWMFPDVIAFEAALFRFGIDGWLVGSKADYLAKVEALYRGVYGASPPPTFVLASVPRFRGIGEPADGFGKTRLLRALLESDPMGLGQGLSVPWKDNPTLVSDLIARGPGSQ